MKKLLSILALALAFVACQTEPNDVVSNADLVDVVLNVAAPELDATRVAPNEGEGSSASGAITYMKDEDWNSFDLRYILEVYAENGNLIERQVKCLPSYDQTMFEIKLVPKRNYKFVVFADFVAEGNANLTEPADLLEIDDLYYDTTDLKNITAITTAESWNAMHEQRDAYFITKDLQINVSASETLTLTRPFAKLRVIATDIDAIKAYSEPGYVEVEYYTTPIYKSFNAVTGKLNAEEMTEGELTYEYPVEKDKYYYAGKYDADKGCMTLFTDYLLAVEGEHSYVNFKMTVYEANENGGKGRDIHTQDFSTTIPIQRNHLTTIVGDLLTTQANITVDIDNKFEDEYVIGAGESDTKPVSAWGSGEIKDGNYEFVVTGENDFVVIVKDTAVENNQLKAGTYEFVENKADLENGKFTVEDLQATRSLTNVNVVGGEMIVKAEETNYNITLDLVLQYEDTQEYRHAVYEYEGEVQFGESLDIPYVTATVDGNTVTVKWEAVEGATKYFVAMNEEAAVETAELSKVYENLEWNTLYTFSVKAANDTLESVVATVEATTGEKPADEPEVFEPVASEWGVVGDLNNWGGIKDYVLYTTETENLFVAEDVKIQSGAFKIRANNKWDDTKNYGFEVAGKAYADKYYAVITGGGSQNMTPMEYGTYDVYFDLANKRIALMTPGKAYAEAENGGDPVVVVEGLKDHTWGLIGSFAGSDWGKDVATTVEGDWAVAKNVTIAKNNEFKFRADGAWTLSYGSACDVNVGKTYTTQNNGGNMKFVGEDGAYDFYFSLVSAEFYMTEAGAVVEPEPVVLATPEVTAAVEGNVVTLSWTAIENAAKYGITVGTEMPVFVEDTTYAFTGEYETEYTFNVVAVPADEENFAVSEAAVVTATTEAEPAEEVVYTTVAEFLAAPVDDNTFYYLKGTITSVVNTSYGNFDLTDETGTVYVYGLYSEDGATNKYWAASGAKLADDIVIYAKRAEFNGTAQAGSARFVELITPGTLPFWSFDKENVVFGSAEAAEQTVNVTAYNTTDAFVVSSNNDHFTASYANGVVTIATAANTTYEKIEGVITVTCGNLSKDITVSQAALKDPNSEVVAGEQYSYTFTKSVFSANGTKALGDLNWTIAGDGGYWGWDNNGKGQQFGSKSKPYTSLTMSTEDYTEGVESITINTAGASNTAAKLEVYVGGVKLGQTVSLTSASKDYTFTNNGEILTGKIELKYTQTSKVAIYIKAITIN